MKLCAVFFFFIIANIFSLTSQNIVSGRVTDKETRESIGGVVITLLDGNGETIAYDITKKDGSFSIRLNRELTELTLESRLLGYENYTQKIENKTQQLYIEMSFGEIELREVVVKSRPIWNREDTLVYSVDAFKSVGDKTIGDLLKKLPGVEVSESGGIKYQGEAINKFYIEGLNLLENRYGIATNNVPVEAVQNVEVIENHQPVNSLKDVVASSNAAINLRLKKDKMERPVGTITLGAGFSDEWLWLAEAFALSAGKSKQLIAMYKTNNAGKDIASELNVQTLSPGEFQDVSRYTPKTLLNARSFNYPPLEKKRYLMNNSHVISLNNLWKTGENATLRFNVQYLFDKQKESINQTSDYFLPNGRLQITENNLLTYKQNMMDAAVTYTNNNEKYYFNNSLTWTSEWTNAFSSVLMNEIGVHQRFSLPAHLLKNDLNYILRTKKRIWDVTSFSVYSTQPQLLTVKTDTIDREQSQLIELKGFYSRNSTYYSWNWGRSAVLLKGALEVSLDNFNSQLTHPVFSDSTRADIAADYFNLELTPSYTYQASRLRLTADVNIKQHLIHLSEKKKHKNDAYRFIFADPSLRITYNATPMLNLRAGYRYNHSVGDFMELLDVYIMPAYRNFYKRADFLSLNKRHSFSGGFRFRNPLTTFFLNSSILFAPSFRNLIGSQRLVGTELISGSKELNTRSDMWMWQSYIGKYFADIRTNVSLSVNYNSLKTQKLQQGIVYPFSLSGWTFFPKVNLKISDNCSVSYQAVLSNRTTEIETGLSSFKAQLWQAANQLSAFYLIGKKWQFNIRAEHNYNDLDKSNSVKMFFADASISYKSNGFEFNLSANNIFNQENYSYSIFTGLDNFSYVYNLRPRMLMASISFRY